MTATIGTPTGELLRRAGIGQGDGSERWAQAANLLDRFLDEVESFTGYPWDIKPDQFESGRAALGAPPEVQSALVVAVVARLCEDVLFPERPRVFQVRAFLPALLRKRPPLVDADIHALLDLLTGCPAAWSSWVPVQSLMKVVERSTGGAPLTLGTLSRLKKFRATGENAYMYADERKALEIVERLLNGGEPPRDLIDGADDWGAAANAALSQMDSSITDAWRAVLEHAATAEASKPAASWLKTARERIAALGGERFAGLAAEWLLFMRRPASGNTRIGSDGHLVPASLISDGNSTLIRGLAWMGGLFENRALAAALGDCAVACFTKIPEIGARCTKGGNGCIHALGAMPGLDGAAQLARLQQRITYSQARRLIDAALDSSAARAGFTRDDLADLAAPTFGLIDGTLRQAFGEFVAEIAVAPEGKVATAWFAPDGTPRKSEPAEVKRTHADELKALKRTASDLDAMLGAQRLRIERFLMMDRVWPFAAWRERLLDHPLLGFFARRLIWSIETGGEETLACWLDGRLVGLGDAPVEPSDDAIVRLFHPVHVDAETIRAWQVWLEEHRITQPFKQAHRETYRLTDAERTTETYSNRFAGHILHQHQFAALCTQRGWTYRLQSAFFDGGNVPTLALPVDDVQVEFWVEVLEEEDLHTQAGIGRYVTTDQVAFSRRGGRLAEPVRLEEIPPALFSEVMRDVDLFVGVCSVGADELWQGRDGERYGAYWRSVAFGDLTQGAKGRRELLERLLPSLAIAARCTLEERFLVVRGELRTYRIHLGSGKVMMAPDNRYLCIVPQRWGAGQDAAGRLYLPFEGDSVLSVILSKAMLLANDAAITDPTITRQIRG